jgi:hypothetical protein
LLEGENGARSREAIQQLGPRAAQLLFEVSDELLETKEVRGIVEFADRGGLRELLEWFERE